MDDGRKFSRRGRENNFSFSKLEEYALMGWSWLEVEGYPGHRVFAGVAEQLYSVVGEPRFDWRQLHAHVPRMINHTILSISRIIT